jgi:hypothetical protein
MYIISVLIQTISGSPMSIVILFCHSRSFRDNPKHSLYENFSVFKNSNFASHQWLMPIILATMEAENENRTTTVQGRLGQITGSVSQVVEHQLCKHKALSSNSSPTKSKLFQEVFFYLSRRVSNFFLDFLFKKINTHENLQYHC